MPARAHTAAEPTDRSAVGLDAPPPPRPARAALVEIAAFSALTVTVTIGLPSLRTGDGRIYFAVDWLLPTGQVVLSHLGWGLAAYIPILLGFYAIVVGGQLVAAPDKEERIRRVLGLVAEAMASALVPALVLTMIACVADIANAGALYVVIPVAAVTFFLAVQLGGFVVFSGRRRLAAAERTRDWAEARLPLLTPSSRRPIWLVAVVNVTTACVAGLVPILVIERSVVALPLFTLCCVAAGGLTLFGIAAIDIVHSSRDRFTAITMKLSAVALYAFVAATALQLATAAPPLRGGSLALVIVMLIIGPSTVWPRRQTGRRFPVDWSVSGAGAAVAARSVARVRERAEQEIRDLTPAPADQPPLSLGDRVRAALEAFATGHPEGHRREAGTVQGTGTTSAP